MQKNYSELIGMPVATEYSPSPVALIRDIIIDPENGKVLAFMVRNQRIIVPLDIVAVNRALIIADKDHILHLNDVLRVQTVYERKIGLIGARIITEKEKAFLGRVVDYEIDTKHMILTQIHAAKTIFFFRFQERFIPRKRIVRIDKHTIVVKEPLLTVKDEAPARESAFA